MGEIIVADRPFPIEWKVINFKQPPFWNATVEACVDSTNPCGNGNIIPYGANAKNKSARRYALRPQLRKYGKNPPLDATKAVIKQFVLHHDGCWSAEMCWNVLHNERGLSCHFLIDNDGTIYQTIDLAFMAYHAAEFNVSSIGVEFCNRGDAGTDANAASYAKHGLKRTTSPCKINGHTILAYDFTPQQYDAIRALASGLARVLPNLPFEYPQEIAGKQSWNTLPPASAFAFAGYIGHYHLTGRKWDPGPFDFKKFCEKLRGALCFPLWTGSKDPAPGEKPAVPTNLDDLIKRVRELNDANEKRARGGFFPVGPWGEHRIWHGGVHLKAKAGQQVFAPFPGRIVCARMGKSTPAGSANFVLLRHNMAIGKSPLRFYSLYMHLRDELTETDPSQQPAWMQKDAWKTKGGKGKEVLLDEPVEAGEVIGRVGVAGPGDMSEPQIHFEIFSPDELFTEMGDSRWILMDGSAGSRICDLDDIINKIDADKDKRLSKDEITGFYSGNSSALDLTHQWVALSVSEWTPEPDWKETLRTASDFAALPPDYVDRMVDEQITETLWWTEEVAKHCRLPVDGVVYHYQPVAFLRFVNQAIVEAALKEPDVKVDAKEARAVPKDILDDFGDVTGESAVVLGHDGQVDIYQNLTLEQILQGYQGDTL